MKRTHLITVNPCSVAALTRIRSVVPIRRILIVPTIPVPSPLGMAEGETRQGTLRSQSGQGLHARVRVSRYGEPEIELRKARLGLVAHEQYERVAREL